jgi:hypothetical protein
VFARERRRGMWRWIPVPDSTVSQTGIPTVGYRSFEHFLAPKLYECLAPLVALENPYDILPTPHGAVRVRASDHDWQQRFAELAREARCILTSSGQMSLNVELELRHILTNGLAFKLLLCTSPPCSDRWEYAYLTFWGLLFGPEVRHYLGLQPGSWSETAQCLRNAGYTPPTEDPGAGAILSFDTRGRAQLLVRGAEYPEQYVKTIVRCLNPFRTALTN